MFTSGFPVGNLAPLRSHRQSAARRGPERPAAAGREAKGDS